MPLPKLITLQHVSIRHSLLLAALLAFALEFWIAAVVKREGFNPWWIKSFWPWLVAPEVRTWWWPMHAKLILIPIAVWFALSVRSLWKFLAAMVIAGILIPPARHLAFIVFGSQAGIPFSRLPTYMMKASVVTAVFGILLGIVVRIAVRGLILRIMPVSDHRCARCGYDIGRPDAPACPECGSNPRGLTAASRVLGSTFTLGRHPAITAGVLLLPIAAAWIIVYTTVGQNVALFRQRFENRGFSGKFGDIRTPVVIGWAPLEHPEGMGVTLRYAPWRTDKKPAMTIQVEATAAGLLTVPGHPDIMWNLSGSEAADMLREFPNELLERRIAFEVQTRDWRPIRWWGQETHISYTDKPGPLVELTYEDMIADPKPTD